MTKGIEHKPTKALRDEVSDLASNGINQEEIAEKLGIKFECLVKHYRTELRTARIEKVRKVGNNLFQAAMKGDITAMIFFLKTQGRWRTEDNRVLNESKEEIKKELKEFIEKNEHLYRKDY